MPSQLTLIQEYLRDPPFVYSSTVPFLFSNDQSFASLFGGAGSCFAWKFVFYTLSSPIQTALIRLQLLKLAAPLHLHQSSESVDDFSFASKSQETLSLLLSASGAQSTAALPATGGNKQPSLISVLLDGLVHKDGFRYFCRGVWINVLHSMILNWSVSRMTLAALNNLAGHLNQMQLPFEPEYLVFAASDFFMRSFLLPMDVLLVRTVNTPVEQKTLDLAQGCIKQEGIEGLYAHFSFSLLSHFVTNCCKILPCILFDVYVEGKLPIQSPILCNLASVTIRQALLLTSLFIRIPFDVLRRRLYSRNVYYSRETTNPTGLLSCLKGILLEEGIGTFFRGFWFYWLNENIQYLIKNYLSYERSE